MTFCLMLPGERVLLYITHVRLRSTNRCRSPRHYFLLVNLNRLTIPVCHNKASTTV